MIKDSLIIIPNPSDENQVCDFLLQTAKLLAKNNLVFMPTLTASFTGNSFLDQNGVHYLKFLGFLPFKRFAFINYLNQLIYFLCLQTYFTLKFPKYKKRYIWMFFPEFANLLRVKLPFWQAIYDLVDFHFALDEKKMTVLKQQKKYLLQKADYIFSISKSLANLYQPYTSKKIKLVPQGFALLDFTTNGQKSQLKLPRGKPIIGFVGQMSERLDFVLLHDLIAKNPQWNFVFIGSKHHEPNVSNFFDESKINKLFTYQNSFHFNSQAKNTILDIIKQFDVCIVPYDVVFSFNRFSYPMKIFEYFYAGKPIVSTPIEELKRFSDLIKMASTASDFAAAIKNVLIKPWSEAKQKRQKFFAMENSWENKLEAIAKFLC